MSDFGMSAPKVFANDSLGGNPAFWSVLQGGFAGTIEGLLHDDAKVTDAIKAKFAAPNDVGKRLAVIKLITRATANCIGQKLVGQHLDPEDESKSVLRALDRGTDDALNAIIGDSSNVDVHNAFASKSVNDIIHFIVRQTGRGLFQASMEKTVAIATHPFDVLAEVKKLISG